MGTLPYTHPLKIKPLWKLAAWVTNLEESKEMLPAQVSAFRDRHRICQGLVQISKVSDLGVFKIVYDGNMEKKNPETQNYLLYKDLLWRFLFQNYDHWTKTVFRIYFLKTYHYFEIMKKLYISIPVCGKNKYIKMQGNDKHN